MRADQKISERRNLREFVIATIALIVAAAPATPAFAQLSPEFANTVASAPHVQLAQASVPPGVGSLNDYMHQSGDGPSGTAVPAPGYSPQPAPPLGYYPQTVPRPEYGDPYADPNAARSALIGAAVVGAIALGLWAWQQHEIRQAQQQPAPRRFHSDRRAVE